MTRKQLSQIYFLDREMKMWDRKLSEYIQTSTIKSPALTGMPHGSGVSSKVEDTTIKIQDAIDTINRMKAEAAEKRAEVYRFIETLDDSFLKQIIMYRCCELMEWDRVASMIGAGTSADSCRMYYNRKIPKE